MEDHFGVVYLVGYVADGQPRVDVILEDQLEGADLPGVEGEIVVRLERVAVDEDGRFNVIEDQSVLRTLVVDRPLEEPDERKIVRTNGPRPYIE